MSKYATGRAVGYTVFASERVVLGVDKLAADVAVFRALSPIEAGRGVMSAAATLNAPESLVLPLHRVARLKRPQQVHSSLLDGLVFQSLLRIAFFIICSQLSALYRILLLQGLQLAAPAIVVCLVSTQFL